MFFLKNILKQVKYYKQHLFQIFISTHILENKQKILMEV